MVADCVKKNSASASLPAGAMTIPSSNGTSFGICSHKSLGIAWLPGWTTPQQKLQTLRSFSAQQLRQRLSHGVNWRAQGFLCNPFSGLLPLSSRYPSHPSYKTRVVPPLRSSSDTSFAGITSLQSCGMKAIK